LKRTDRKSEEVEERVTTPPLAVPVLHSEEIDDSAEEVPFIEVGPHKSMEASPSVLASLPAPIPVMTRHQPQAKPPSVQFRAIPSPAEPTAAFAPELLAYHDLESNAARQCRAVLDAVLNSSPAGAASAALLFAASTSGIGTTTTVLNVAITAAKQTRRRVVVVDANPRQPGVAERLGLPVAPGLREALAGAVALDQVVRATAQANLFAVTAGVQDTGVGLRFVAETTRSLLRQLRQRFSLVFVDGPPWDGRADTITVGAACDAVYVVVPEHECESPQTDALLQVISNQGARLAGCILVAA
jgi:Mrp family chromosome partitioning ATPase